MLRLLFSIADIYNLLLLLEDFDNPRMPSPSMRYIFFVPETHLRLIMTVVIPGWMAAPTTL